MYWQVVYNGRIEVCLHPLQWRHNGCDGVSNHQPRDCLPKRLIRHRPKKTPKLRVTGFVMGIHRWQTGSNAENFSIWWRHHVVEPLNSRALHCENSCKINSLWTFFSNASNFYLKRDLRSKNLRLKNLIWYCKWYMIQTDHHWFR